MTTPIQRARAASTRPSANPRRRVGVLPAEAFGSLPDDSFGVIVPGLTRDDVVKVGGFALTAAERPILELIPVPRGVDTRVEVVRGEVARGLRVELRRSPPRVVQLADMAPMSRAYNGSFPDAGAARVDFYGFKPGSIVYLQGRRSATISGEGPFPVSAPTDLAEVGVLAPDGTLLEGTFSARPGDLFEVFPTDLSLATRQPWYLATPIVTPSPSPAATQAPTPTVTAAPSPSPSAPPPAPSPSPSASPAPSSSPDGAVVPAVAVLTIVPGAPNATVTLDGTVLGGPPYRAEVPQGSYVLQVAAEGYEPRELVVDAVAGQVAQVQVPLARRRSTAGLAGAALAALLLSGGIYAILRWTKPDDRMERADNPSRDREAERRWVLANLAKLLPGVDWRRAKVEFLAGSWVRSGHPRWEVIAGDLVVRSWEPVSRSGGLRAVTWVGHNHVQVEVISGSTRASQKQRPALGAGRA